MPEKACVPISILMVTASNPGINLKIKIHVLWSQIDLDRKGENLISHKSGYILKGEQVLSINVFAELLTGVTSVTMFIIVVMMMI